MADHPGDPAPPDFLPPPPFAGRAPARAYTLGREHLLFSLGPGSSTRFLRGAGPARTSGCPACSGPPRILNSSGLRLPPLRLPPSGAIVPLPAAGTSGNSTRNTRNWSCGTKVTSVPPHRLGPQAIYILPAMTAAQTRLLVPPPCRHRTTRTYGGGLARCGCAATRRESWRMDGHLRACRIGSPSTRVR